MASGKHPGGRPPKYTSTEKMQAAIDAYFTSCEGKPVQDADGNPVLYKGKPVIIGEKPPTVTGLALALGFTGRQALLDYQAKKQFADTITRAKSKIEAYTEERLFDKDGVNGAKFSLQNNFKGWSERGDLGQNKMGEDDPITRSLKEDKANGLL